MSASVLRYDSKSYITWQAHCNHARESEQYSRPIEDWPRPTISSPEFNYLCKEALDCLREPKDANALLEGVWVRLCHWLGTDSQLNLPDIYEYRTEAYLQAISSLLRTRLCDDGQEDQRLLRLVLVNSNEQAAIGESYEM